MLETEEDEIKQPITNVSAPYNKIGVMDVKFTPLKSADLADEAEIDTFDIEDETDLIGKEWNYKCEIKGATGLPICCDLAYCQYEFFGQVVTSPTSNDDNGGEIQATHNPVWNHEYLHHIDTVTEEFLDFLNESIDIRLYASPYVLPP